jgi:hypothetical protein|tara:strand:+ start:717 stop:893 length:177 start_codon:yes stop_codon:yes gene_type:complete
MMSPDESQQLNHLMQKQMALEQKQYLNAQQHQNIGNQSPERQEIRGHLNQNQGYDQRA